MGKTVRRFGRSEVPKSKPYKKSGKINIDQLRGLSAEELDKIYDEEDFDEYYEEEY